MGWFMTESCCTWSCHRQLMNKRHTDQSDIPTTNSSGPGYDGKYCQWEIGSANIAVGTRRCILMNNGEARLDMGTL